MSKTPHQMMDEINREIAPARMSAEAALEWLEELAADIEGAIDGLKCDLANAES